MRRALVLGVIFVGLASMALAVNVVMKDGTVIAAKAYTINGSYVMVTLEDGRQVAYDVADVDVAAMQRAEAASSSAEPAPTPPPVASNPFAKASAASTGAAAMTITDKDVTHVGGTGEAAAGEEENTEGPPKGYQEGGQVVVQGLDISEAKPGVWRVQGEVVNRLSVPASDVKVSLEATAKKEPPSKAEAALGSLAPGQSSHFLHDFTAQSRPQVRLRVYWLQAGGEGGPAPAGKPGGAAAGQQGSTASGAQGSGAEAPRAMQWGGGAYQRGQAAGPTPTPTW
ncbi:MAG: hypothetical protein LJE95_07665 [Acidobacteria bacterium]|nr:hypothetical protein [Acidobacteriota bacterium]